jgi:hypothetical protein
VTSIDANARGSGASWSTPEVDATVYPTDGPVPVGDARDVPAQGVRVVREAGVFGDCTAVKETPYCARVKGGRERGAGGKEREREDRGAGRRDCPRTDRTCKRAKTAIAIESTRTGSGTGFSPSSTDAKHVAGRRFRIGDFA